MIEQENRLFTKAEHRLLSRRARIPALGSVFWMRDERRVLIAALGTATAILVAGLLLHLVLMAWID